MRTYTVILLAGALLLSNCQKAADPVPGPVASCNLSTPSTKAPQAEVTALKQFLDSTRLTATADERGFYYVISSPGSGAHPTLCSNVRVNYSGQLTNGTRFDQGTGVSFDLARLIVGWQQGIPLIAPGGRITLYLPPSLAYGAQAQNGIPANSILIFTIDLLGIN
jgi:FKBP-type peptidyl-prolyl cis-trans isomerase FkpA